MSISVLVAGELAHTLYPTAGGDLKALNHLNDVNNEQKNTFGDDETSQFLLILRSIINAMDVSGKEGKKTLWFKRI